MLLAISVNQFFTSNGIEMKPSQTLVYETTRKHTKGYEITSNTHHTGLTEENPEWRLKMETTERLVGGARHEREGQTLTKRN